jgi:hypothetical protein
MVAWSALLKDVMSSGHGGLSEMIILKIILKFLNLVFMHKPTNAHRLSCSDVYIYISLASIPYTYMFP